MTDGEFESFEWDEAKSDRTFQERGFDFEFASRIFDGDYIAQKIDETNMVKPALYA